MNTLFRLLFPVLLCAVSVGAATDWPTFRGNPQRTGYYPDVAGYPRNKTLLMHVSGAFVSSPSISDGILYIGGRDSTIYAIDALSGKVLWKKKTAGWVDSSPLIYEGNVIVGSRDATMYVLDSKSGANISMLAGGVQLSSPAMLSSGTVISGMGPPLYGISGFNWSLGKKTSTGRVQASWSITLPQMSYSSPALLGQAGVIGADDGKFYGLDAQAGKVVWSVPTGGSVYLSTPAIDAGSLVAYFAPGEQDNSVYAVGLLDGKVRWQSEGSAAQSLGKRLAANPFSPSQMVDLLRLSPPARQQYLNRALSKQASATFTDADNWVATGGMKTSSVALDDQNVYVVQKALGLLQTTSALGTDLSYMPRFTLLALDKRTGTEKWRFSELKNCVPAGYCSSPVVTGHMVFAGWGGGILHAFDKSGNSQWSDTLPGDIISSPAIANGNLYVATITGSLYKYALAATAPAVDFQRSTYCYPNPARGNVVHIQVYVPETADAILTILNVAEKPVYRFETKIDARSTSPLTLDWNLSNVANGVYFALIKVKYSDGGSDKKLLKIAVLK